jgi:hypothetical protein
MPRITWFDEYIELDDIPEYSMEDPTMPRMCPECHEPTMGSQTYTCDNCWSGMTSQRRDMYQNGTLPEKAGTNPTAGITWDDIRGIGEVLAYARRRIKYGTEGEFMTALVNDLMGHFARTYPRRVFDMERFIDACGGPFSFDADEERSRQRGDYIGDSPTNPVGGIFDDPPGQIHPTPSQWHTEPATITSAPEAVPMRRRVISEAMQAIAGGSLLTPAEGYERMRAQMTEDVAEMAQAAPPTEPRRRR